MNSSGWRRHLQVGLGWLLPLLTLWYQVTHAVTLSEEVTERASRPQPLILDNFWKRCELQPFATHRSQYCSRDGGEGHHYPPPIPFPAYKAPRALTPAYPPPSAYTPMLAPPPTPPLAPAHPGELRWDQGEATYHIPPDQEDGTASPLFEESAHGGTTGLGLLPDNANEASDPAFGTLVRPPPVPANDTTSTAFLLERPTTAELSRMVCNVQRALSARGYDLGPIDCQLGGRTREALLLYQQESGLPATGRLDARTLVSLGVIK